MVTIRTARPEDEAALKAIDDATRSPAVTPAPNPPADRPFFHEQTAPEDVLVAEDGTGAVGFVWLYQPLPVPSHQHVLEISGVGVTPHAQGRGLGRQLMDAAKAEARNRGARKVTLRVLSTNPGAQHLYRSTGFVVEGILRGEFIIEGKPVDDILMAAYLED